MAASYFTAVCLGGRWYVVHTRTGTIVPATSKQAWYESEALARAAAR